MSRIRSIKPEFFQHEGLFDAEKSSKLPLRIAFAGLWTQVDREGRFEWRPRQLKLNVLPYDEVDFSAVLSALESNGFVVRYVVDGKIYGYVPSFLEHQCPNVREPSSTLPAPSPETLVKCPESDSNNTGTVPIPSLHPGKGREGKGREREVARAREAALATPGLDVQAFEKFEQYRSGMRKPLTRHSFEEVAKTLASVGDRQDELVSLSIRNDWQGIFPEKLNGAQKRLSGPIKLMTYEEALALDRARGVADV